MFQNPNTLAQIDAALKAPSMKAIRETLATAAEQMKPLLDAARPSIRDDLNNKFLVQFGLQL
jgi:hypothetical protein